MLKNIAIVVVLLVGAVLVFAAFKDDSFRVQRSITIKAPPEKVQALIEDFHQWQAWSPWEHIDPTIKRDITGAPRGLGAVYAWKGDGKAGQGRMEVVESKPGALVKIKLDFVKPFPSNNTAEFTLVPQGDSTQVNWAMYGASPYIARVMTTFVSMDSMIGKDFDKGLADMKKAAEK